jgi:hypothetical protein
LATKDQGFPVPGSNKWRAEAAQLHARSAIGPLLAHENLLLVARTDLGVSSDDLERGDLLRIFNNDLDEHLIESEATNFRGPSAQPAD